MNADTATILEILNSEVSLPDPAAVTATTSLRREAQLDSLDFAVFLLAVQDKYGMKIPDNEVDKLDTVTGIAEWLNSHAN